MKALYLIFFAFLFCSLAFSCVKPPEYPDEPVLSYNTGDGDGFNQSTIAQGSQGSVSDTLILAFSFTDGDGDIGYEVDSFDVFFTDSRFGIADFRRLPIIPDQGTGNGIEGKITLRFPNQPSNICCAYENAPACSPHQEVGGNPTDTFSYTLQIRDRAGNWSNKVQTETVTIICD